MENVVEGAAVEVLGDNGEGLVVARDSHQRHNVRMPKIPTFEEMNYKKGNKVKDFG